MLQLSLAGRAEALHKLGRYSDAVADWDKAVPLTPPAEQPSCRASRANSLLPAGQVERAVAEVEDLSKSGTWSAGQWYDFACVYGVASGKLADKRGEYAVRAVELLGKAVAAVYRDRSHIETDADLDALRGRADFRALVGSLPYLAPPPRPAK